MKNKYSQQDYLKILNSPSSTYFGLVNRGMVIPNVNRLDKLSTVMKDFPKTNTFVANNTLAQSNPYSPNQVLRKKK
jgi:hypothetical protein|tara:strand:- start:384 stop:611 length:228 start_codon:yes stop_codon:yes gene_type:complete